MIINQFW